MASSQARLVVASEVRSGSGERETLVGAGTAFFGTSVTVVVGGADLRRDGIMRGTE